MARERSTYGHIKLEEENVDRFEPHPCRLIEAGADSFVIFYVAPALNLQDELGDLFSLSHIIIGSPS